MRCSLVSACLVTTICTGIAVAQSPVAYVYVAEDAPTGSLNSPTSVYAASSAGKLTPIKGSPFTQTLGTIIGTNGTHFLTVDQNDNTTHQYLRVYNVASDGVIGEEVSKQDLHEWCGFDQGGVLDHTGQYVYVVEDNNCGGGVISFALSKKGGLTFKGFVSASPSYLTPVFSGNDKFVYTFIEVGDAPCPTDTFLGLGRESSGALENISFSETDPTAPSSGYQATQNSMPTADSTNHLAASVTLLDGDCGESGPAYTGLASYTIQSNGDLVSTNTWQNLAPLAAYAAPSAIMKMNPAGNIVAVAVGTGIQFFHFNGADPITPFAGNEIIGTSGYIQDMAWDSDNHLYALNAKSGRLHVYDVTTKSVVEAPGSPYLPQNSCTAGGCYPQTLVVRIIP
jgi:hypothetical protein